MTARPSPGAFPVIGRKRGILLRGAVGILFLLAMLCPSAPAAEDIGEGDVKVAFVHNFIKFVEWPSSAFVSPDAPIVVSVLGNDPTASALASLDGKMASGRQVVVRKVSGLPALERCHVLYIGASGKGELAAILGSIQRWPTLTIADFEGFAGRGGTIGFIRRDDRVGFQINEKSARKAGLKVSAKLLYLGKIIPDRNEGGMK